MGRGRQKAKQTKVARELKYHTSSIDVTSLQRELSGEPVVPPVRAEKKPPEPEEDPYRDRYGGHVDDEDDDGSAGRYAAAWQ
jgi:hypothetical protein